MSSDIYHMEAVEGAQYLLGLVSKMSAPISNYVTNCEQKLKGLEVSFCLSTGKAC